VALSADSSGSIQKIGESGGTKARMGALLSASRCGAQHHERHHENITEISLYHRRDPHRCGLLRDHLGRNESRDRPPSRENTVDDPARDESSKAPHLLLQKVQELPVLVESHLPEMVRGIEVLRRE